METASTHRTVDIGLALLAALVVEGAIFVVFATHVELRSLRNDEPAPPKELTIAVQPVLDDVPLLKLGSKKQKYKLPDMWRKPKPKKRFKDVSAASTKADKELPEEPIDNELAKEDEELPPEDAELAKDIEETPEVENPEEVNLQEEGGEDGIEEGTETDPLKAHVLGLHRAKILLWFKRGFSAPTDAIDCATLAGLNTKATASISPDGTVTGYSVSSPSGNATFDARVRSHLDRKVGQRLPPPPPKYPEFREPAVHLNFSGRTPGCKAAPAVPRARENNATEAPPPAPPPPEPQMPVPAPEGEE